MSDDDLDSHIDNQIDDELSLMFVFAGSRDMAQEIRNLLEFMDTHSVEIAEPTTWLEQLKDRTLSAVFLAPDLPEETRELLIDAIGRHDATISVVVVDSPADVAA